MLVLDLLTKVVKKCEFGLIWKKNQVYVVVWHNRFRLGYFRFKTTLSMPDFQVLGIWKMEMHVSSVYVQLFLIKFWSVSLNC